MCHSQPAFSPVKWVRMSASPKGHLAFEATEFKVLGGDHQGPTGDSTRPTPCPHSAPPLLASSLFPENPTHSCLRPFAHTVPSAQSTPHTPHSSPLPPLAFRTTCHLLRQATCLNGSTPSQLCSLQSQPKSHLLWKAPPAWPTAVSTCSLRTTSVPRSGTPSPWRV